MKLEKLVKFVEDVMSEYDEEKCGLIFKILNSGLNLYSVYGIFDVILEKNPRLQISSIMEEYDKEEKKNYRFKLIKKCSYQTECFEGLREYIIDFNLLPEGMSFIKEKEIGGI